MKHDIIKDIKRVASELGRAPTYDEYMYGCEGTKGQFSERQMRKHFGGFSPALTAAGLAPRKQQLSRSAKFKFKNPKLESVVIHEFELPKLKQNQVFKLIAWPDTHVPNQETKAIQAVTSFMKDYKPDAVVLMGDFLDCAPLS